MPLPTVNYVWIGEPGFRKGGRDVIGPETVALNLKKQQEAGHEVNPIVFWCQAIHKATYQAYFKEVGLESQITVKDIDSELASQSGNLEIPEDERKMAHDALLHYQTLTGPERNRVLDRVFMKDMFFNYILATHGGYVLDTSIMPKSPSVVVRFPSHEHFYFPEFFSKSDPTSEVWMQYAPPGNEWAKNCFKSYLRLYSQLRWVLTDGLYSKQHHHLIGRVAVHALEHRDFLSQIYPTWSKPIDVRTWGNLKIVGTTVDIPHCNLSKEYINSHRPRPANDYSVPHRHVLYMDLHRLEFEIEHGVDFKLLLANPTAKEFGEEYLTNYDAESESLLHLAIHKMVTSQKRSDYQLRKECVALLIRHGADLNQAHTLTYITRERDRFDSFNVREIFNKVEESPLTFAIRHHCIDALDLLLTLRPGELKLNEVLNRQTPLMLAISNKNDPLFLIKLLEAGADPNQEITDELTDLTDTPLSFALEMQNLEAVRILLEKGASPTRTVTRYVDFGEPQNITLDKLITSEECLKLLSEKMESVEKKAEVEPAPRCGM